MTMNDRTLDRPFRRWLFTRIAALEVFAILNFAVNLFGVAMTADRRPPDMPPPSLLLLFAVSTNIAIAWVVLSVPLQLATRRLRRNRIGTAVVAHIVMAPAFAFAVSALSGVTRVPLGLARPDHPLWEQIQRHFVGFLPFSLLVYAAIVAGTLAWDNWRLSVHRERTAAQLAGELSRAELAALRSKMQPHFLFNALNGISSVMDTDVERARRMMVALSQLMRSSLSAGGESLVPLEQELQFTRDYLDLQHMRFEDRLRYELRVDARPDVRVPSFILPPLVENAVVRGLGD